MDFFELVAIVFEVAGVGAMVVGFVIAVTLSARLWWRTRDGARSFRMLRETIGSVILLGLEILVAADLVKTVTSTPSLTDALVLGIIVIIRTLLSFSLQIEIEGTLPWRRLATTGPQLFDRAVKRGGEPIRRGAEEQRGSVSRTAGATTPDLDPADTTPAPAVASQAVADDESGFPELRSRG